MNDNNTAIFYLFKYHFLNLKLKETLPDKSY